MWDERYAQDDYVFGTEPAAFLAALIASLQAGQRTLPTAKDAIPYFLPNTDST